MAIRKKHKPVNTALLHTGQLLKQRLRERGVSAAELGRRLGRGRETIRRFFKNPTIQTSILLEISTALHYNFFKDLAALLPPDVPPALPDNTAPLLQKIAELEKELEVQKALVQELKDMLRIGMKD